MADITGLRQQLAHPDDEDATMMSLRALPLVLPFALLVPPAPPTPVVGPPWISIEYPANPYDATTRSAFLLVHAFHHGTPVAFPVTGSAEGLVNGTRRSIPLSFTTTSRTGVYAVAKQWPNEGVWTLVVTVTQGRTDTVSAIVDLSPTGEVMAMRVPLRERSGEHATLPAAVSMAEVEASLRARAGGGARGR